MHPHTVSLLPHRLLVSTVASVSLCRCHPLPKRSRRLQGRCCKCALMASNLQGPSDRRPMPQPVLTPATALDRTLANLTTYQIHYHLRFHGRWKTLAHRRSARLALPCMQFTHTTPTLCPRSTLHTGVRPELLRTSKRDPQPQRRVVITVQEAPTALTRHSAPLRYACAQLHVNASPPSCWQHHWRMPSAVTAGTPPAPTRCPHNKLECHLVTAPISCCATDGAAN